MKKKKKKKLKLVFNIEGEPVEVSENSFKEWLKLQETGTGTNAIATYARPIGGMVRRTPIDMFGFEEVKKKRKKS